MKQLSILTVILVTIFAFGFHAISAQFPLKIPKLPKTEKPKAEQSKTNAISHNLLNLLLQTFQQNRVMQPFTTSVGVFATVWRERKISD
jgi:ABC-type phosphate transport system permease subunit